MALLGTRAALGLVLVTIFLVGAAASHAAAASAREISEYQVKAAMLVQFSKFVEWPSEQLPAGSGPFVIAVVGDDSFSEILDRIVESQTIAGHEIVSRRYKTIADLDGIPHVLFVSRSEQLRLSKLKGRFSAAGVLTVGDADNFAQNNGIIGFVQDQDRVAFDVNVGHAERCRLKISSKLLALAKRVIATPSEAGR